MPRLSRPRLTLTDFIRVVTKSGTPKATAIRAIKHRPEYTPQADFYKALREHIVDVHRRGGVRKDLKTVLAGLKDDKKRKNYPAAVKGYSRWWGTRDVKWFEPPSAVIKGAGVELSVNPELGLRIEDHDYIIKLHFPEGSLTRERADIINRVLQSSIIDPQRPGALAAVLDVRPARLQQPSGKTPAAILDAIIDAELEYIGRMWSKL